MILAEGPPLAVSILGGVAGAGAASVALIRYIADRQSMRRQEAEAAAASEAALVDALARVTVRATGRASVHLRNGTPYELLQVTAIVRDHRSGDLFPTSMAQLGPTEEVAISTDPVVFSPDTLSGRWEWEVDFRLPSGEAWRVTASGPGRRPEASET